MPLIQNPNIGRKLQRSLRLTELPDGILAPEVVAVILVEDASAPLSDEERGCMVGEGVGPVALENPFLVIQKTALSQYDAVVTGAWFSSDTDQIVRLGVPTTFVTGLTGSANTTFTDLQTPGRPASLVGFDTAVGAPGVKLLGDYLVLANSPLHIPLQVRLGVEGFGPSLSQLMIAGLTVNTALRAGFSWIESAPLG